MTRPKLVKTRISFWLILLLGSVFRLYNLNWGEGFFFHPDENNIAHSVIQLNWPNLHPHFFAYGQFPIYLAYFYRQVLNWVTTRSFFTEIPFSIAISDLRFFSSLESILAIWLVFLLAKKIFGRELGLIGALLTAFTPGLIQAAHFGTTESLLTLILLAVVYLSLNLASGDSSGKNFWLLATLLGIGLSTKINSLAFFSLPLLALLLAQNFSPKKIWKQKRLFFFILLTFIMAFLISFLTSPYQVLDFTEFRQTAQYEIKVALGTIPVFYTRQFFSSQPLIFQLVKIFPYSLNPILEIAGLLGLIIMIVAIFGRKEPTLIRKQKILLIFAFFIYLLPNSLVFAKWARFITPILPWFSLFALESIYFCHQLDCRLTTGSKIKNSQINVLMILILSTFLSALAYLTIYLRPDIRLTASSWLERNLPPQSQILSEAGNVIDIPLKGNFRVVNLDFYGLEENREIKEKLMENLAKSEYLLIPSRRIFADHLPDRYPETSCYYQLLFSGQLGFSKIGQFSAYPTLLIGPWQIEFPDEQAEESWTVFDHPVVRIYQKINFYSTQEYRQLFKNCLVLNQSRLQ